MKKTLIITGNGIALERFAREQRLRFKKEGFSVTIGVPSVPVHDTKSAPAEDVKDAPAEEEKPEPVADVKDAPAEDKKTTKKSNKK
ncbi:MAG: hypothetical protein K6A93_11025 [Bacteroidaceae bacterium]|nr:hypothetical protein [Bacteroidaceae bacterium]